nr:unnamed protein product [Spirometra erinaceieuropaei]
MAGLDSGHGNPPTDRNPERPGHSEATADALERPPREDESSGILTEQQSHDVEDVCADEVTQSGGYLGRLRESPPLQPPPQNATVEMAELDSGHGNARTDRNPQRPGHVEATAATLEQPPREDG